MFKYAYGENNLAVFYNALWSPPHTHTITKFAIVSVFLSNPYKKKLQVKGFWDLAVMCSLCVGK